MKKYKEEVDETSEEITEEEVDTEVKEEVYDENVELKKKAVGRFYNKKDLIDQTIEVEVLGLQKNKFGKDVLLCKINDEERTLAINDQNFNDLISMLGTKIAAWKGKVLKVSGKEFVSENPDYNNGVRLTFELA